jgi:dTDP-4-dehydrorhamnose reductase
MSFELKILITGGAGFIGLAQKVVELLPMRAYGLYLMTNSGACSWYEFAAQIFKLLQVHPDFGPTTTEAYGAKARRPAYSVSRTRSSPG